jgi:hypothetical protein
MAVSYNKEIRCLLLHDTPHLAVAFGANKEERPDAEKQREQHGNNDEIEYWVHKQHIRRLWPPCIEDATREIDGIAHRRNPGKDIQIPGQRAQRQKDASQEKLWEHQKGHHHICRSLIAKERD